MESKEESSSPSLEELIKDWDEKDKIWLQSVPEELRMVAAKHGPSIFQVSMQAGAASSCFQTLHRRCAGNNEIMRAATFLNKSMNDMLFRFLRAAGKTPEDVKACQREIESVSTAQVATMQNRIIVPTRH